MKILCEILVAIILAIVTIVLFFNVIEYGTDFAIFIIDSIEKVK